MTDKQSETDRLILRQLQYGDAEVIEAFVSDVDVAAMTANIPHPYPHGGALRHLKKVIPLHEDGRSLEYALVLKENRDAPIGSISVNGLTESQPEIGYWLGKPFWCRGLMTEALRAIVDIAFMHYRVQSLFARTHLVNTASKRVLSKCGFQEIGKGTCDCPARVEKVVAANLFELNREHYAALHKQVT